MITGKLNLSALPHVKMEKKGRSGMVKGIFIPFEAAKLYASEKGNVFLDIVAFEMKEKKEYSTHLVKQSLSKDTRAGMSKEELESIPILGNLNVSDGGYQEANNDVGGGTEFTADGNDDLPF